MARLPGLVTEADSLEALSAKLPGMVEDLLEFRSPRPGMVATAPSNALGGLLAGRARAILRERSRFSPPLGEAFSPLNIA